MGELVWGGCALIALRNVLFLVFTETLDVLIIKYL